MWLERKEMSKNEQVEEMMLQNGFDHDEISTLYVYLCCGIEGAPIYTILSQQHPLLWAKYQDYLDKNGLAVEGTF